MKGPLPLQLGNLQATILQEPYLHLLASGQRRCGLKDANIHMPYEKPRGWQEERTGAGTSLRCRPLAWPLCCWQR